MKPNNFKHSMLTVGVIAALGLTGTAANAQTSSGSGASSTSPVTITNRATATYQVDGVAQPDVTSNVVIVNISEMGSFTLIAPQGAKNNDDKNEAQKIAPGGSVNFTNILENTGNVNDEYTIELSDTHPDFITGATDDFPYENLGTTDITLKVTDAGGSPVANNPDGSAYPTTINSGDKIKLAPGHKATLSYDVTPDGTPDAGESGLMQISATSKYIGENPTNGNEETLINEDQGIITKPIFAIEKRATNGTLDLNATDPAIKYTITVTNEDKAYSADATNIGIKDVIPEHFELDTSSITVEKGGSVLSGVSTTGSDANTLAVSKINLAKGESVTITFTVKVTDKDELAKSKTVTNNATVYDKFGSSDEDPFTNPDITDSTDETNDDTTNGVDEGNDDGNDEGSTVTISNIKRGVSIEDNNTKELPQTGSTEVKHTITNTGNTTEGDEAGELTITVKDNTPSDEVKPTGTIKVDIYAKGATPGTDTPLATNTVNVDGSGTTTIDIHDISTAGIPAGGKAVVTYTEESVGNNDTNGAPKVTDNTNKVSVKLTDPNASDPDEAVDADSDTDTFNIGTLKLVKEQAKAANCDAAVGSVTFQQAPLNDVEPGQCVVYRITATNTFTGTSLTDVTIKDLKSNWDSKATYVDNSAVASVGGVSVTVDAISTDTIASIDVGNQATLTFKVKVK